jgi:hypothetical protein
MNKESTPHRGDGITVYLPSVCFSRGGDNGGQPDFEVLPEAFIDLEIYLAVLVIIFFVLSFVFQFVPGLFRESYKKRVENNGVNKWRYIEYSLSASVMMVAIACVLTIYDFFTHILVFTCTFLCMHLGLVADFLRYLEVSIGKILTYNTDDDGSIKEFKDLLHGLKWFVHALSWVAVFVPYIAVLFVSYSFTVFTEWDCLSGLPEDTVKVPDFVHAIVLSQFALFSVFGVVQIIQFCSNTDTVLKTKRVGIRTEFTFIILSLIAKTLLGWLIAFNVLV